METQKNLSTIRQTEERPEERIFCPQKAFFPDRKECPKTNQNFISTPSTLLLVEKFKKREIKRSLLEVTMMFFGCDAVQFWC